MPLGRIGGGTDDEQDSTQREDRREVGEVSSADDDGGDGGGTTTSSFSGGGYARIGEGGETEETTDPEDVGDGEQETGDGADGTDGDDGGSPDPGGAGGGHVRVGEGGEAAETTDPDDVGGEQAGGGEQTDTTGDRGPDGSRQVRERQGGPEAVAAAPQRANYDDPGDYVEAATEYHFSEVGDGEVYTVRDGDRIEPRFTERGAEQAAAERMGVSADQVTLEGDGPFTVEDIDREIEGFLRHVERYEPVADQLGENLTEALRAEAGKEARERAREQEQRYGDFREASTEQQADAQRARIDERVADQVAEQTGVPVTEDDVTVTPGEDEGEYDVSLSAEAQRAAALTATSEFLRRDAEIEREDGELVVDLPGDSDAMEEALTQRIQTGEAFGPADSPLDVATGMFADAVQDAAAGVVDVADEANVLSGAPPFVGGDEGQDVTDSGPAEAGEDVILQAAESAAAGAGEIPRSLVEIGETATDPLAYQVGAEGGMMALRRFDDINVESAQAAGEGAIGTAQRLDRVAQRNPEAAASVSASLLGGAALGIGTAAATPAALSRIASVSPTTARGIAAALDPVRTTARAGASVARSGASVVRRADFPDADSLNLREFLDDDRAMAQLTGGQRGTVDTDQDGDVPSDTGTDYEPSRGDILEGSPRDQMSGDITERAMQDLRQAEGDYEGEPDAFGTGREATYDPERDVADPEDILEGDIIRREAESPNVTDDATTVERTADAADDAVRVNADPGVLTTSAILAEATSSQVVEEATDPLGEFETDGFEDVWEEDDATVETDPTADQTPFEDVGVTEREATTTDTATDTATTTDTDTDVFETTTTTETTFTETPTETDVSVTPTETRRPGPTTTGNPDLPDFEDEEEDEFASVPAFSVTEDQFDTGIASVEELEQQFDDPEPDVADPGDQMPDFEGKFDDMGF